MFFHEILTDMLEDKSEEEVDPGLELEEEFIFL